MKMYRGKKNTNSRYKCTIQADTNVADTVMPSRQDNDKSHDASMQLWENQNCQVLVTEKCPILLLKMNFLGFFYFSFYRLKKGKYLINSFRGQPIQKKPKFVIFGLEKANLAILAQGAHS